MYIRLYSEHKAKITLVPGFVARNNAGENTTLGRGGSDFTAAILAHVLNAPSLEIWTDVSGMYTAHPRIVPQASPIPHLSYLEAMELSHFGAKVIYLLLYNHWLKKTFLSTLKTPLHQKTKEPLLTMAKTEQMDRLSKELVISTMFRL